MVDKDLMEVQYIGHYGRGQQRAYCSGVGELYYLEIVTITLEQFEQLPKSDWRSVDGLCRHITMSGELCSNLRASNSPYCLPCGEFFKQRALFDKEK